MIDRPTCMERAFALAEEGKCENLNAIRKQLKAEGYPESGQLSGSSIRNQFAFAGCQVRPQRGNLPASKTGVGTASKTASAVTPGPCVRALALTRK